MAKKFLEEIDEAFGGEILADVIPHKKKSPKSTPLKSRSSRKKSFLSSLDTKEQKVNRSSSGGRKKSFLDAIEAALEDQSFEDVIPNFNQKTTAAATSMDSELQRLSMAIPKAIMQKLKSMAKRKGIPLNDLIRAALDHYMSEN